MSIVKEYHLLNQFSIIVVIVVEDARIGMRPFCIARKTTILDRPGSTRSISNVLVKRLLTRRRDHF